MIGDVKVVRGYSGIISLTFGVDKGVAVLRYTPAEPF